MVAPAQERVLTAAQSRQGGDQNPAAESKQECLPPRHEGSCHDIAHLAGRRKPELRIDRSLELPQAVGRCSGLAWLFGEHLDLHPGFYACAATLLAPSGCRRRCP